MTINDAYVQFLNIVNRNNTNNNISIDKGRFVLLFNSTQNRFVEWILEKRNEDDIRQIARLLVPDKELTLASKKETFNTFKLPKDYFDLANLSVFSKNDSCNNIRLYTFEAKMEDVEELYQDKNNEPSLDWRETFYLTSSGNMVVYKKNFDITKAVLAYYRYPKQVNIAGWLMTNGQNSTDIDPEFEDRIVNRILLLMGKEFSANNNDPNGYQLNKDRGISEV